jgi:hypothetical protein
MQNVGSLDRVIRVVLGLGILALWFVLGGNARYFALLGLVPLLTAGISFCPLYSVIGVRTCPAKASSPGGIGKSPA